MAHEAAATHREGPHVDPMNNLLLAAAVLSLLIWGIHTFAGGPAVAAPLLDAKDLEPVPKYTNYYGWHIVTVVLLAMPASFALGAFRPESRELAILMTVLSAAFALWSVVLVIWKRQKPFALPQWCMFAPLTVLGALGLWL